ncbi:MAG: hypothetical protein ABIJ09_17160 [Pseudomonadota bacterium]
MSLEGENLSCPHCGATLRRLAIPDGTSWTEPYHLVCFNDDCEYFVRGWTWMEEQYAQHKSYRYRVIPGSGEATPLPVWSKDAMKNSIMD